MTLCLHEKWWEMGMFTSVRTNEWMSKRVIEWIQESIINAPWSLSHQNFRRMHSQESKVAFRQMVFRCHFIHSMYHDWESKMSQSIFFWAVRKRNTLWIIFDWFYRGLQTQENTWPVGLIVCGSEWNLLEFTFCVYLYMCFMKLTAWEMSIFSFFTLKYTGNSDQVLNLNWGEYFSSK